MKGVIMKYPTFAEFVKMLDPPYKIPEYMKSFIKDMENNKRYCICLHRHAGRRTINRLYKEYLEKEQL